MSERAWHFTGDKLRDGRPIPADGEWLVHHDAVKMCASGLHASRDPFDALQFSPGATLCLVECEDVAQEDADKLVCRRRKIIARRDVTEILRWFARMQALSVIHLYEPCPVDVVLDYLMTGDESIRDAAWAAARDAARDAAWDAARDAAWAAEWAAARDAAWDAAWAAARDAAWAAAWAAARTEFNSLIHAEFAEVM